MIEMVIILVIIAILASLAIPIFRAIKKKAQIARMQAEVKNLTLAVRVFELEYSKYPTPAASVGMDYRTKTDGAFMAILLGLDADLNPRKRIFFESTPARDGSPGLKPGAKPDDPPSFVDTWGNECFVKIDGDYDGAVDLPGGGAGGPIREGVIAWSTGFPPPVGAVGGPASWIKSWE